MGDLYSADEVVRRIARLERLAGVSDRDAAAEKDTLFLAADVLATALRHVSIWSPSATRALADDLSHALGSVICACPYAYKEARRVQSPSRDVEQELRNMFGPPKKREA